MKRKFLALALCGVMATFSLAGCSDSAGSNLTVGMVTDSGTIDDKSFNQGTWEGIMRAEEELGVKTKYLKPSGETEADYLKEIANLYDAGFKMVITPGFKFETAIYKAQDNEKYQDAKFVILDGAPNDGAEKPTYKVGDNAVSIFFAEQEAGFLAGVATAVELKEADLGFIGGMAIPPVQKFNWGFQQGVAYANENLGTNMTLEAENIIYQGTFYEVAAGTQIAASMYDKGVDAIFCAAGGVGAGAIKEATERASKGEEVWIVGVDTDQYAHGYYDSNADKKVDDTDASVILTSAVKRIDTAAYNMIDAEIKGEFPGGQTLTFDSKNAGVGIPDVNPNLSDATVTEVKAAQEKIKSGELTVIDNNDNGAFVN